MAEKKAPTQKPAEKARIAKKDFVICQNQYRREIRSGEDISDVPEVYLPNLKTEGVL